jgi:hypothetical protein
LERRWPRAERPIERGIVTKSRPYPMRGGVLAGGIASTPTDGNAGLTFELLL